MNNLKNKLANSFNVMYQDVVNEHKLAEVNTPEYIEAKDYVEAYYPKLNNSVMEYLAMYMCVQPNGRIEFIASREGAVGLLCRDADKFRRIVYSDNGVIVKDQTELVGQKGE